MLKSIIFIIITILFSQIACSEDVAKVIIIKGQAKARLSDGKILDVVQDLNIPEGAIIQTAEKSFVKLIFLDKSQLNIAASSQIQVTSFPKNDSGIITLVKGQIRSQVTKDYMKIDDKEKSKLYIKTKTAAMGVRGTDFQVNYNNDNQNTSLITFEGKVAMTSLMKLNIGNTDRESLEKELNSNRSVQVEKGQFSAVNLNLGERAMAPTKLSVKQFEALKNTNENINSIDNTKNNDKKINYQNPLPPGVDAKTFSNPIHQNSSNPGEIGNDTKPASGFFNQKTGEYKLPAGSVIDLKTVNIVPPPANAIFDNNTNTFNVPENYGAINPVSGDYTAPAGLKLQANGTFNTVDNKPTTTPLPQIFTAIPDIYNFAKANAPTAPTINIPPASIPTLGGPGLVPNNASGTVGSATSPLPPGALPPGQLVQDKLNNINNNLQNNTNLGPPAAAIKTPVQVIINAP